MATYLIDCGSGGELLELGRRVVASLGPDAVLGRSSDLAYGGVDARPADADVFLALQAGGAPATETWVHPRAGARSRALADSVLAEMGALGARGVARSGDLSALAPERQASGAAACLVELDERAPRAIDGVAQALARAARGVPRVAYGNGGGRVAYGAPYGNGYAHVVYPDYGYPPPYMAYGAYPGYGGYAGAPMRVVRALDDDAVARFQSMLADPSSRSRAASDPNGVMAEMGTLPPEIRDQYLAHLRDTAAGTSSGQAWTRGLAAEVTVEARWYGIVISLNNEATQELINAGALTTAVISAITAAFPEARVKVVLAILGAVIGVFIATVRVVNRGNGVNLTIPWTALVPGAPPIVIPTPR